jgi:ABC-2 type transport system permease protein
VSSARVFAAFLRRDWAVARSYRLSFSLGLFGSVIQLTIYFTLGRLVDRGGGSATTDPTLAQGYFSFVVVGMAVLTLGSALLSSFSTSLRSEQISGALEALLATPAPPVTVILGTATFAFLQAVISTVVLLTLAFGLFGLRFAATFWSALVAVAALLLLLALFAACGIFAAALTLAFKQAGQFTVLVGTAVSLLGGAVAPTNLLPSPLRQISRIFPFAWGLETLRVALFDGSVEFSRLAEMIPVAIAAIIGALWSFDFALRWARRAGSLAQY